MVLGSFYWLYLYYTIFLFILSVYNFKSNMKEIQESTRNIQKTVSKRSSVGVGSEKSLSIIIKWKDNVFIFTIQ